MKQTLKGLLLLSAVVSFASFSNVVSAADLSKAKAAIINNDGANIGAVDITEGPEGVLLNVTLTGLPAGKHGFRIHGKGDCSDHDAFKMSGSHVSDDEHDGEQHGLLNPEGPESGDLPNLIVPENGAVVVELYAPDLALHNEDTDEKSILLDDDGSAFVIHTDEDDHMTQPIGGAGARIACGVIQAAE